MLARSQKSLGRPLAAVVQARPGGAGRVEPATCAAAGKAPLCPCRRRPTSAAAPAPSPTLIKSAPATGLAGGLAAKLEGWHPDGERETEACSPIRAYVPPLAAAAVAVRGAGHEAAAQAQAPLQHCTSINSPRASGSLQQLQPLRRPPPPPPQARRLAAFDPPPPAPAAAGSLAAARGRHQPQPVVEQLAPQQLLPHQAPSFQYTRLP